jgi:hypothetical protein
MVAPPCESSHERGFFMGLSIRPDDGSGLSGSDRDGSEI